MGVTIPVLYKDEHILIACKPPEVLVHPHPKDKISQDCITILSRVYRNKIYTVHRIDRGTSGIVVFALDPVAADGIAEQFREKEISKRYFAVVRGHVTETTTVDRPVRRGSDGEYVNAKSIVRPISTTVVAQAVGQYDEAWYSFVEIELLTGRTHQARKHLKSLTCPVIGDNRNGDRTHNRFIRETYGVRFLFLRSYSLTITHPVTGIRLHATAGLPEWWINACGRLDLAVPEALIAEPGVAPLPDASL